MYYDQIWGQKELKEDKYKNFYWLQTEQTIITMPISNNILDPVLSLHWRFALLSAKGKLLSLCLPSTSGLLILLGHCVGTPSGDSPRLLLVEQHVASCNLQLNLTFFVLHYLTWHWKNMEPGVHFSAQLLHVRLMTALHNRESFRNIIFYEQGYFLTTAVP